jgi:hypothetical protein
MSARGRWQWQISLAMLLGAAAGPRVDAQPHVVPRELLQGPLAIVGGTVLPVAGPMIRRGVVIIRGGKIEAVGPELPLPPRAKVVDATGKLVTPGLVAIETAGVGLAGTDGNIADSLDPYDLDLRLALASGITTAHVIDTPAFGFFGDEIDAISGAGTAVIKLTHGDLRSMLIREPGLNYFAMPTRQLELNLFRIRESFRKAAEHLKAVREAAERKTQAPRAPPDLGAYIAILENQRPTVVAARDLESVRHILDLHAKYPFDLILSQPSGAYAAARELAGRRVPVLLNARGQDFSFDFTSPVLDADGLIPIRLPAAFADLGASVIILPYRRSVSLDGLAGRDLTALHLEAAFAVRGGLDESRALEAITLGPARLLRLADRIGSLEKGKDADVLIWSRHPLDYRAYVERAYIDGKLYYERDKATFFKDVPLQ